MRCSRPPTILLLFLLFLPAALPGQEAPSAPLEPYTFRSFTGDTVQAELGRLRVPLRRDVDNRDSLTLAFVRFPATTETPGPPIIYLAGGPGGSGVSTARGTRFPLFMALREHGDVIAFDQRGTGMSEGPVPEECPVSRTYPPSLPLERGELRRLRLEVARECGEFWQREGVDLAAYNTRESADDVAALAVALGAEQVRLWGISYGTHLGLAVMRRHPALVERAILAGVEGPDHTIKLPSYWTGQLARLQRLVDAQMGPDSELSDLEGLIGRILERLEEAPAPVEVIGGDMSDTVRSVVSRFQVESVTTDLLRDPPSMVRVPWLFQRMAEGDFTVVAGGGGGVGGLEAMPEAMDAASGISRERRERYLLEASRSLLGGGGALIDAEMAEALGVPDLGPEFRAPVRSDVPTLFISGTLDGRTPVGNAEEVLDGFSRGRHLVIENAGHSDDLFLSSPRILEVMLAFFADRPLGELRIRVDPPDVASGRLPPSLPASWTEAVVGAYERGPGDVWRVLPDAVVRSFGPGGEETGRSASLMVRIRGNGYPLAARNDTTLFMPGFGPDLVFRFVRGPGGAVERLEFTGSGGETVSLPPVRWEDVGFLEAPRWRVAGPYQLDPGGTCDRPFPPETSPDEVEWVTGSGDDGMVDFEETLGGSLSGGVGYAALSVQADEATEAWLRVGSDDDLRVELDGRSVHTFDGARTAWETEDVVPIRLEAGGNPLLVKVCNQDSDWGFTLRLTDGAGRALWSEDAEGGVRVRP